MVFFARRRYNLPMRLLAALLLAGCAGSPDSVTVGGGRNQAHYDTAGGAPAFDEQGYAYWAALTWNLPTKRSLLQDEQQRECLELLRSMDRSAHEAASAREQPIPVIITQPPAAEVPKEDWLTLKIKGFIGAAATLATAALAVFRKKLGIKIPSFKKKPKEPHA